MSSTFSSNGNGNGNGNSKNGQALPSAKSGGVSSRELTDTITRLEAMREQVQGLETNEAALQEQLTEVQGLIAHKQAELTRLMNKVQELRQAQAGLEQLLFGTALVAS